MYPSFSDSNAHAPRPETQRLRHLLTRTPEWKSTEERERLADMCNRDPALAPLAAALHAKSCSALRKVSATRRVPEPSIPLPAP